MLCHKVANTTAPLSQIPLLEGQPAKYLYAQTKAFKEKRREDYAMQSNVANLSDRDMRDIAEYLAKQKPLRGSYSLDPRKIEIGKAKSDELKCGSCHLATFAGIGEIPRLAGQTPGYLRAQLEAFNSGKRRHASRPGPEPAMTLGDIDREALAHFLASLEVSSASFRMQPTR
jgi:cytochrome c553